MKNFKFAALIAAIIFTALFVSCPNAKNISEGGNEEANKNENKEKKPPYDVWKDSSRDKSYATVFEGDKGPIGVDNPKGFYRIPALIVTKDGVLLAFADKRFGDNMDTGFDILISGGIAQADRYMNKNKPSDIVMRKSSDAGKTWSEETVCARGDGHGQQQAHNDAENNNIISVTSPQDGKYAGHCDAVPAADRDSEQLLFLTCSGSSNYENQNGPNYLLCFTSLDGGKTWTYKDISSDIERLTGNTATNRFFGSGRATQSKIHKKGSHYRVYAHVGINGKGYVMYTDDFGSNWKMLKGQGGNGEITGWDEVKVTEFDDGSLLIVGKQKRDLNPNANPLTVFRYSDVENGTGTFENNVNVQKIAGTECNGDMIIVKAKKTASGEKVNLVLASYPLGPKSGAASENKIPNARSSTDFSRFNIGIYWKEFKGDALTLPEATSFNSGWCSDPYRVQGNEDIEGVYSVMQELPNKNIGILYEEGPATRAELKSGQKIPFKGYQYGDWNVIKYKELDISDITGGQYSKL
ncbi:sialidase family protein [Treponema pedis]|uniref:sialidase family protein n=2 Tax=Treponema pedis TaxID=409322 RepID=UPI003133FB4B